MTRGWDWGMGQADDPGMGWDRLMTRGWDWGLGDRTG